MKTTPTTKCDSCRCPEELYTRGRHAGLVKRHFHPYIPGLRRCPGSYKAPAGGAR